MAPTADVRTVFYVLRPDFSRIPAEPGVYRFLAADGRVLYVGKALRLKDRLGDYFSSSRLHQRTKAMLEEAADLAWLVCSNEQEALLVEASLIRALQPPYNVRLREDREAYPYIALSDHTLPRVMVWHGPARNARRFGPYPSPSHAFALRSVLEQVWQLRPCTDSKLAQHEKLGRACLLGDMGRCCAPCVDPDGYQQRVDAAVSLLDGKVKETAARLGQEMNDAAGNRAFEAAALLRDQLQAVEHLTARTIPTEVQGVVDALGVASDAVGAACQLLRLRDGALRGCPTAVLDPALHARTVSESFDEFDTPQGQLDNALAFDAADAEAVFASGAARSADTAVVDAALSALYSDSSQEPARLVLVPHEPSAQVKAAIVSLNPKSRIRTPNTAKERALLALAEENAKAALGRARLKRADDATTRRQELTALAAALGLPQPPLRIECVDISHFAATGTVAAVVVLEEGVPRPSAHRRYRLDDRADDPASITEVVARRVAHLNGTATKPDPTMATAPGLLLIDGGPVQLAAAVAACEAAGVSVPVASLSKRLEEVWLPHRPAPVRLALDSPALYVLQRARDEAHRTAISYQRRIRKLDVDPLQGILGLGPRRRQRLLDEAGSLDALRSWPKSRFAVCAWLPQPIADAVFARLH